MVDPMAGLGEDVHPKLSTDALVVLELIRDTILTPKPVGRDQAALAILASCAPLVLQECGKNDASAQDIDAALNDLVNTSVSIADKLVARLERP